MGIRIIAMLAFALAQFVVSAHAAPQAYVHDVSGDVKAQVGGAAPVAIGKNQAFESGTTITTGPKSHAVLKFEDGQVVMLKENTTFEVRQYAFNAATPEKGSSVLALIRGGLRVITGLLVSRNREGFKLETPTATMGIRGTDFAVEMVNPLFGQVFTGVVSATNAGGTLVVNTGQAFTVVNAATLGSLIPITQIPAGILQFPNVPLPPATPGLPGDLSPLGGTPGGAQSGAGAAAAGGGVTGAAVAIGAAIAVGAAAAGGGGGGGVIPIPNH